MDRSHSQQPSNTAPIRTAQNTHEHLNRTITEWLIAAPASQPCFGRTHAIEKGTTASRGPACKSPRGRFRVRGRREGYQCATPRADEVTLSPRHRGPAQRKEPLSKRPTAQSAFSVWRRVIAPDLLKRFSSRRCYSQPPKHESAAEIPDRRRLLVSPARSRVDRHTT